MLKLLGKFFLLFSVCCSASFAAKKGQELDEVSSHTSFYTQKGDSPVKADFSYDWWQQKSRNPKVKAGYQKIFPHQEKQTYALKFTPKRSKANWRDLQDALATAQ